MQTTTQVTHEEYFDLLAKSDFKLEYNAGEIAIMIDFPPVHNIILARLTGLLGNCTKHKDFLIYSSHQLLRIESCDKYAFPDLLLSGLKPSFKKSPYDLDALQNPIIIIEVLSDSTEVYDRLEKFDCYKTIPSFKEYVLVSSKQKKVEVIKKLTAAEWLSHTYTNADDTVVIGDCMIQLEDIYNNVELSGVESPGF